MLFLVNLIEKNQEVDLINGPKFFVSVFVDPTQTHYHQTASSPAFFIILIIHVRYNVQNENFRILINHQILFVSHEEGNNFRLTHLLNEAKILLFRFSNLISIWFYGHSFDSYRQLFLWPEFFFFFFPFLNVNQFEE